MVKQFNIPAKTSQGRDTFVYVSEEVPGMVHIIAHVGGVHVKKEDLLTALEHLGDVVGDEHDENH